MSSGDFLGTGRVANKYKEFVSYGECKKFAIDNNIKTKTMWFKVKRPQNIPSTPQIYYENFSWSDLLGVEIISDKEKSLKYLSYDESVEYIKDMGFKSLSEYKKYVVDNNKYFLPAYLDRTYRNKGCKSSELYLNK